MSYDELLALVRKGMRPGGRGQYRHAVFTTERFYLAEDYHQKYSLRHDAVLMREFAGYTPRQLVDSTVAARLNGIVAGHACSDLANLGLSPAAVAHLRKRG